MHSGQEANVSLLQRKSRPEAAVRESMGKAAHLVRQSIGLGEIFGCLATGHRYHRSRHQLADGTRIVFFFLFLINLFLLTHVSEFKKERDIILSFDEIII